MSSHTLIRTGLCENCLVARQGNRMSRKESVVRKIWVSLAVLLPQERSYWVDSEEEKAPETTEPGVRLFIYSTLRTTVKKSGIAAL